ncbi:expressed unknown protein [Seminavis robusta]|uniref:Dynamin N-terminal domain-containing protein n=1 Tax=Seminavis robusta TaxID=568900 RepID=A0A9N8HT97_9STRA|nr:expressed unknown protein [Seminavis robusta]|eukprot:Sro1548_g281600.1 n/a (656) ;mRNA; r:21641-23608
MFEIRIGVIGYVSVGKTTVINALFGEEFGEVAMKRTTAVVNSFRISSPEDAMATMKVEDQDSSDESVTLVSKKLSASVTLKETSTDNASFRNSNDVKEKTFDIELEESLHKMRPDTKLVIVDVPGINEAGTSSKYKDFVNSNWHTFDIVVLVMDARQGVNTEEQLDLLKLVKDNLTSSKDVPVIILANKVDDPFDREQKALLDEAREAIANLFGVGDRERALQLLLNPLETKKGQAKRLKQDQTDLFPVVIPISAMHAFVYRCGSRLSFDEFIKMDKDFIEKIGKHSYGWQWHQFGEEGQLQKAFKAVSETDLRKGGMIASNFEAFVKVLQCCIGDKQQQTLHIEHQVKVALERMKQASPGSDLGTELITAYTKLEAIGRPVSHLPKAFWASFDRLKNEAFNDFKTNNSPASFTQPIGQLCNYHRALQALQWPNEMEKVAKNAKALAVECAVLVIESDKFSQLSESDQSLIVGSMLLSSSETAFNLHFGFLRLYLESKRPYASGRVCTHRPSGRECYFQQCNGRLSTCPSSYGNGVELCGSCSRYWIMIDFKHANENCPYCLIRGSGNWPLSAAKKDGVGLHSVRCNSGCTRTFVFFPPTFRDVKMKAEGGQLVPVDENVYKKAVTVDVPDSPEDPNHFGHVLWKCCQLLQKAEA